MPRFECVRDDIPKKWTEAHVIPGEEDNWYLIMSNGVADPSGNEITINKPAPVACGSLEEVTATMERQVQKLTQLGYKPVQVKKENDVPVV